MTLTFDPLQGQSCCRAGDHNSLNLLVIALPFSGPTCSLPAALDYIGLSDIMLLVQLMCLCAAGKVMYTSTCGPNSAAESLSHLTTAIGALVQDSPSSLRQLVQLCTQVCVIVSSSAAYIPIGLDFPNWCTPVT